jgi:NADP-dependent aldehyde dehydrogenase
MGSINPVVFLPQAVASRLQPLADAFVESVTLGTGQFCTNPGLGLILDTPDTAAFIQTVGQRMESRATGVLLNAGVEENLRQAVARTRARAGVDLVAGGTDVDQESYSYSNTVMRTRAAAFLADPELQCEHFGPATLFVVCESVAQLQTVVRSLEGNLTATIFADDGELELAGALSNLLREKAGRLLLNNVPTGVEVVYAQTHGGPYPATTIPSATSVGMLGIKRWLRPVTYQNFPDALLPPALKSGNPLAIWRVVNGQYTNQPA